MQVIDKSFTGPLSRNIEDYPEGLVLNVDKPWRWTSADVIRKIKFAAIRHFGKRNLKVGHAGTLDPLATGVLLVCIGNACKRAEQLQASGKEYIADICFGATTPSYDREKEIDRRFPTDNISETALRKVLPGFIGEQKQIAPLFSARQVDGVRAYELARRLYASGGSLDEAAAELLRVTRITISGLELLSFYGKAEDSNRFKGECPQDGGTAGSGASSRISVAAIPADLPAATLRIACSKGTYIRSLARDLGEALDSGAFLAGLQRSRSGEFSVSDACGIGQVLKLLSE